MSFAKEEMLDPQGFHECDIFTGEAHLETAESGFKWKNCTKNPGHEKFFSVQDFKANWLPKFQGHNHGKRFQDWIDQTVRLRVHYTSTARPDDDQFAKFRGTKIRRFGTGFIQGGFYGYSVDNQPCPCRECDGQVVRKYWEFTVEAARHVMFDSDEAKQTKVDIFYDDENCEKDGRMKTLFGVEILESERHEDMCEMRCVTHDKELAERIKFDRRTMFQNELSPQHRRDLTLLGSFDEDCQLAVMVSHPHGQPKKVSVGKLVQKEDESKQYGKDDGIGVNIFQNYTIPSCPGCSGAPVFKYVGLGEPFDPQTVQTFLYPKTVHSGTWDATGTDQQDQLNYGVGIILEINLKKTQRSELRLE